MKSSVLNILVKIFFKEKKKVYDAHTCFLSCERDSTYKTFSRGILFLFPHLFNTSRVSIVISSLDVNGYTYDDIPCLNVVAFISKKFQQTFYNINMFSNGTKKRVIFFTYK